MSSHRTVTSRTPLDPAWPSQVPSRPEPGRLHRVPRTLVTLVVQTGLIAVSNYAALLLRFDGSVPRAMAEEYLRLLPWLLAIRCIAFIPFGLYGGLWRYTGVWDLSRILSSVAVSSALFAFTVYRFLGPTSLPRSVVILDALLLVALLGGIRLLPRLTREVSPSRQGRRVLIIGAGDAGEMIVREMRRGTAYHPVGFVDDNRAKLGRTIHGVTVLGPCRNLPRIIKATRPEEVLIAVPSLKADMVRSFVQQLESCKLPISTLPDLNQLVNGQVGVQHIRPLAIEDLLPRSPVTLDTESVRQLIRGRRVLVTGAGGSIGSELCRQIAGLEPESLVLVERYENSLYAINNDLQDTYPGVALHPTIADITDAPRVDAVFATHRPHLVFHAAAHKHVPLMEGSPCEAVKNNVEGTRIMTDAAHRHGVERFVFVSTDKAANPSSVMGATKRLAEMVVAMASERSSTSFVSVRFGNVLGSNGSVVPRMLEQIRRGGPVPVTHPEMRRYFMLIPEAVELVLQAAVLAQSRETFVLDMGEQVKILDLAKNLIRLSGFVPHEEIPIVYIGLREGEKLREELVGEGERLEPSRISRISRVRWPRLDSAQLRTSLDTVVHAAFDGDVPATRTNLERLVPTLKRLPTSHRMVQTRRSARTGWVRRAPSQRNVLMTSLRRLQASLGIVRPT